MSAARNSQLRKCSSSTKRNTTRKTNRSSATCALSHSPTRQTSSAISSATMNWSLSLAMNATRDSFDWIRWNDISNQTNTRRMWGRRW
jgi:hypothetical protein